MRRLNEIRGFEDCMLMLVKFTKKEYVDSVLNGNLYMNSIKYFIDLEDKTKNKGQGDNFEAANIINNIRIKIYNQDTKELLLEAPAEVITLRYNFYETIPLFCLTSFQSRDFNIIEETNKSYKLALDINENEINRIISEFGERAVVMNPVGFINKIKEYSDKSNINLMYGNINYEDFRINNSRRYKNYAVHSPEVVFTKDISLKYQREFRIIPYNKCIKDYYIARIGNLRDGVAKDIDTKEFFTGLIFEVLKK